MIRPLLAKSPLLGKLSARFPALLRFAVGGLVSSTVTFSVTAGLHEMRGLPASAAAAVGFAAAIVTNFVVLRYVVFRRSTMGIWNQLSMFAVSTGMFRGLEYLGFLALNVWLHVNYLLALAMVLGCSFLLKFFVYEGWLFSGKSHRQGSSDIG